MNKKLNKLNAQLDSKILLAEKAEQAQKAAMHALEESNKAVEKSNETVEMMRDREKTLDVSLERAYEENDVMQTALQTAEQEGLQAKRNYAQEQQARSSEAQNAKPERDRLGKEVSDSKTREEDTQQRLRESRMGAAQNLKDKEGVEQNFRDLERERNAQVNYEVQAHMETNRKLEKIEQNNAQLKQSAIAIQAKLDAAIATAREEGVRAGREEQQGHNRVRDNTENKYLSGEVSRLQKELQDAETEIYYNNERAGKLKERHTQWMDKQADELVAAQVKLKEKDDTLKQERAVVEKNRQNDMAYANILNIKSRKRVKRAPRLALRERLKVRGEEDAALQKRLEEHFKTDRKFDNDEALKARENTREQQRGEDTRKPRKKRPVIPGRVFGAPPNKPNNAPGQDL